MNVFVYVLLAAGISNSLPLHLCVKGSVGFPELCEDKKTGVLL